MSKYVFLDRNLFLQHFENDVEKAIIKDPKIDDICLLPETLYDKKLIAKGLRKTSDLEVFSKIFKYLENGANVLAVEASYGNNKFVKWIVENTTTSYYHHGGNWRWHFALVADYLGFQLFKKYLKPEDLDVFVLENAVERKIWWIVEYFYEIKGFNEFYRIKVRNLPLENDEIVMIKIMIKNGMKFTADELSMLERNGLVDKVEDFIKKLDTESKKKALRILTKLNL